MSTSTSQRRHPRLYYIRWILSQYRGHGRLVGLMVLLTGLSTVAAVLLPQLLGHLIDRLTLGLQAFQEGRLSASAALDERNRNLLLLLALGFGPLIGAVYPWLRLRMNLYFERHFRERFFRDVLGREPDFFLRFSTGDLVTRLTDNLRCAPSGLPWLCCSGIFRALTSAGIIGCCLLGMLSLHPWLALAALIPLPLMLLLFLHLQKSLEARCEAVQERVSETTAFLESAFSGIRILKSFTAEKPRQETFRELLGGRRELEIAQAKTEGLLQIYFEFLTYLGEILVLVGGGVLVVRGELSLGAYYAFFSYLGMILPSVMDIPMLVVTLSQSFVIIDRLEEVEGKVGTGGSGLASKGSEPHGSGSTNPAPVEPDGLAGEPGVAMAFGASGAACGNNARLSCAPARAPSGERSAEPFQSLAFRGVGFAYPVNFAGDGASDVDGRPTEENLPAGDGTGGILGPAVDRPRETAKRRGFRLQDLSFEIRQGEKVAVMGPIGSGKSTLLQLVAGLASPSGGEILVNGRPLDSMDRRAWRERIGFVQQEPVVFSETVRWNVDFWRGLEDSRIESASEHAQIIEEIRGLPAGFDERLGVRGTGLSGGQRQRLSLARALAGQPGLLLMDDVTAGLDAANERLLWRRLRATSPDQTCLIVTHRAATARVADRILVLDRGRLVASGRHADLQRDCPLYRELIGLPARVARHPHRRLAAA